MTTNTMLRTFRILCLVITVALLALPLLAVAAQPGAQQHNRSALFSEFAEKLDVARRLAKKKDYESAADFYRTALKLSTSSFSMPHFTTAMAENELAIILERQSQIKEAVRVNNQALDTWSNLWKVLDAELSSGQPRTESLRNQIDLAGGLEKFRLGIASGLGLCCSFATRNQPGKDLGSYLKQASDAIQFSGDAGDPDTKCLTLNMLSLLNYPGDLVESRILARLALDIAPKAADRTLTPTILRRLANVCAVQSDYLPSIKYASAALSIDRHLEGEHNIHEQDDLLILARSCCALRIYERANSYFNSLLDSLAVCPAMPARKYEILTEIGTFQIETSRMADGYRTLTEAKDLSRQIYGSDSLEFAQSCQFLGWAAYKLSRMDQCTKELALARQIKKTKSAPLYDLNIMMASISLALGKRELAKQQAVDASIEFHDMISTTLPQLVTAQQIKMLDDSSRSVQNLLLSICENTETPCEIYPRVLQVKAILMDMLRAKAELNRKASNERSLRALKEKLAAIRIKLLLLRSDLSPERSSRQDSLSEESEGLQREWLSKVGTLSTVSHASRPVAIDDLSTALSSGECLIDFYKYKSINTKQDSYMAFLIRKDHGVRVVRLGTAREIEQRLNAWLSSIRQGRIETKSARTVDQDGKTTLLVERDVFKVNGQGQDTHLTEIEERARFAEVLKPLLDHIEKADTRLLISCDAELFRAPLHMILQDEGCNRLVSQIDSPRDLVPKSRTTNYASSSGLLLVGDVDYSPTPYPPLPGSKLEITKIASIARSRAIQARFLIKSNATKSAFETLGIECDFIHLATHGLFLGSEDAERGANLVDHWDFSQRNPLLNSALLFTLPLDKGSRASSESSPDTQLSADEVLDFDLTKTRHVALSACETGLGESFRGQGICGLRSAFAAAGCRTILMSLWPVDDSATADLMTEYYRQLWEEGRPPAVALAMAQTKIRKEKPSPYFWAGWIVAGDAW
ncbi:MAG: CHAT domain-containing protein [Cyanobacteria bacterium HKST-UBA02]|nr:CHAT domain-containing protein [Cyanobacteria bacterium HKST-UBA02]